jgi:hypothetical protein
MTQSMFAIISSSTITVASVRSAMVRLRRGKFARAP